MSFNFDVPGDLQTQIFLYVFKVVSFPGEGANHLNLGFPKVVLAPKGLRKFLETCVNIFHRFCYP